MATILKVEGFLTNDDGEMCRKILTLIMSNDKNGKTLSIHNEHFQFTIPFEPVEEFMRKQG